MSEGIEEKAGEEKRADEGLCCRLGCEMVATRPSTSAAHRWLRRERFCLF